jgi:hypothetical protein
MTTSYNLLASKFDNLLQVSFLIYLSVEFLADEECVWVWFEIKNKINILREA